MLLHHETWLPERPFSFVRPEPSEKKNDLSSDLSHFLILYLFEGGNQMDRRTICSLLPLILIFFTSQLALAGPFIEPELLEVTEDWLTSEPQAGVDFHIMRVCRDMDMTEDCTKGIYKAKENGAVWIPSNNRCIYRVQDDHNYILYFQLRAATMDGERSQWTLPRRLNVYREVANRGKLSYSYFIVHYETD